MSPHFIRTVCKQLILLVILVLSIWCPRKGLWKCQQEAPEDNCCPTIVNLGTGIQIFGSFFFYSFLSCWIIVSNELEAFVLSHSFPI